jgi:hypothetical protein
VAERVFFLNTLHPGVAAADYEAWVRRVDYPVARAQPAIRSYVVTRIDGHLDPAVTEPLPCQYLEVIEVTSLEEYRGSLDGNAELEALLKEWATYVAESAMICGEVIE